MVAVGKGSAAQSNKYYSMEWDGNSSDFTVKYGRVESTETIISKPYYQWDKIYREKVAKGYKDVTDFVSVKVDDTKKDASDTIVKTGAMKVDEFLDLMQKYTKNLVSQTYSVKATNVTQAQIDAAQSTLNEIVRLSKVRKIDIEGVNERLVELYMTIPRRMDDVRNYLVPSIDVTKSLQQEQDNLDAMASQVKMNAKEEKKTTKEVRKTEKTLLDLLGVESIKEIKSSKNIDFLTQQISGRKIEALFEVDKSSEKDRFDNWLAKQTNKTTKFVYHGTKCTSVIPILQQGLKIRPSGNFQFSGKAYGNGNYFSDQFSTSIGYTDGGRDNVLLIYEVHTGKESKSSFNDYSSCKRAGYDSFEGGWLRVAYAEEQAKIKYIIWLK